MKTVLAKTAAVLAVMWLSVTMLPTAYAIKIVEGPKDIGKPWIQWGVTLGLIGLCALVIFKNAKRGHQD